MICFTLAKCSTGEKTEMLIKNVKVNEVTFLISNSKTTILTGNLNTEDFLNYVLFDGIPANEFIELNNIDKQSFINLIDDKLSSIGNKSSTVLKNSAITANKPSLKEIRDAMIKECENAYCCGLDEACALAVKIAYHIKKTFK